MSGFGVRVLGFRGLGFWDFGVRVWDFRVWVYLSDLLFGIRGCGISVYGLELKS